MTCQVSRDQAFVMYRPFLLVHAREDLAFDSKIHSQPDEGQEDDAPFRFDVLSFVKKASIEAAQKLTVAT
jgi:hypothetical protein